VSLELGLTFESISKILGHKNLKTTLIYAKILDYKKIEAMKKWEKII
jgi:site-specific recombinase XerD